MTAVTERIIAICTGIRTDIEDDVRRREGMPLTGENVAVALGEICAQVHALANCMIKIAEVES